MTGESGLMGRAALRAAGRPGRGSRRSSTAREGELADRLDRAVGGAELDTRTPRWWALAGLAQKALALAALVGALWLLVIAGLGFVQLDDVVPLPDVAGFPLPTLLLLGGLLLGLLLALLARWLTGFGAARRAPKADKLLRDRVATVARELVVEPVEAELTARDELCVALDEARSAPPRRRLGRRPSS